MSTPRRLPSFRKSGKGWTVDARLREFRFIVYGLMPEFVPFDSEEGLELHRVFLEQSQDRRMQEGSQRE